MCSLLRIKIKYCVSDTLFLKIYKTKICISSCKSTKIISKIYLFRKSICRQLAFCHYFFLYSYGKTKQKLPVHELHDNEGQNRTGNSSKPPIPTENIHQDDRLRIRTCHKAQSPDLNKTPETFSWSSYMPFSGTGLSKGPL